MHNQCTLEQIGVQQRKLQDKLRRLDRSKRRRNWRAEASADAEPQAAPTTRAQQQLEEAAKRFGVQQCMERADLSSARHWRTAEAVRDGPKVQPQAQRQDAAQGGAARVQGTRAEPKDDFDGAPQVHVPRVHDHDDQVAQAQEGPRVP